MRNCDKIRMYHQQTDIDRLYIPRMEGEWGLLSTDCVETEEQNFTPYFMAYL